MTCPTCKKPKEKEDYYWRGIKKETKAGKDCKQCINDRAKDKRRNKEDFLYQYFN